MGNKRTATVTIVEDRPSAGDSAAYQAARRAMIDSQLRPSGVNARFVLRRMGEVARESFVPEECRAVAYMDRAVPLGDGRWLAAPVVHGLMLQEARPVPDDRALVVDGGSGYLAELLRPLVGSLEVIAPDAAAQMAGGGGGGDVTLLMIDGAAEQIPDGLVARLAPEGRIVTGTVEDGVTRLAVGRVAAGRPALLPVAELGIPELPEFAAPRRWTF